MSADNEYKARFSKDNVGALTTVLAKPVFVNMVNLLNTTGGTVYLQLFNKAIADVTLGTTIPDFESFALTLTNLWNDLDGLEFNTGLVVAVTTTHKGATPAGTGVILEIGYTRLPQQTGYVPANPA